MIWESAALSVCSELVSECAWVCVYRPDWHRDSYCLIMMTENENSPG